ncbi:MAG: hypothetical protein ACXWT0_01550 [Methylobacter sp.]
MSILDELNAEPLATAIASFRAVRNDAAITALYNEGRTRLETTKIGNLAVLRTLGVAAGNALLDAIYNNTDFRYVKAGLERGDLDVSHELVRATLDGLATAQVITQEQADAVKNLALVPDPVSVSDISNALNGAAQ